MAEYDDLPTPALLQRRTRELLQLWRVREVDVEVSWNRRLSTTAGRAFVRGGRIELNPHLLSRSPDQIDPVLVHEAAHVAAFRLFGDNIPAHGRHWRSLMRLAGAEPEVTHSMPVDDLRRGRRPVRPRYVYLRLCDGCGERVLQQQVRYGRCQRCDRRDGFLVVRTRDNDAGRQALLRMSVAEVRAHFS